MDLVQSALASALDHGSQSPPVAKEASSVADPKYRTCTMDNRGALSPPTDLDKLSGKHDHIATRGSARLRR